MASRDSKYPFFQKLRTVAATVENDVKEIERKLQSSKFELPENNAMFKLIELNDEMTTYKNQSCALLEQLTGENQKYTRYRQDMENLVAEMERSTERLEDFLVGYGYKKWQPEGAFEDDCDQFPSGASHETPVKGQLSTMCGAAEEEKQLVTKTPLLADYGLTAKSPKYLPSALKQGSALKSAKKVHFESPERQQEKGKENNVPYSLQKTPLLEDYGLPSRKRNQYGRETNQGKDTLGIKKQLNFRSPLGSLSGNTPEKNETESLAVAEVDRSENFRELVNSLPSGLNNSPPMRASKARTNVEVLTPEEPFCLRMKFAGDIKNEILTPEEPDIQPVRTLRILNDEENADTPEEPLATPLTYAFKENTPEEPLATPLQYAFKDEKPTTPKTPEFQVTSSFRQWLQLQKK